MVTFRTHDDGVEVEVRGWHRLWALRRRLSLRWEQIRAVRHDPAAARGPKGWRVLGTHVPGVIAAGAFHRRGERTFWDVRHPERAVVIELRDAKFDRLVVEVEEPGRAVRQLQARSAG